jgi:photosystem II stability/assembly factor-like uncharacterized protein
MKDKILPIFLFSILAIGGIYALSISFKDKKVDRKENQTKSNTVLIPATEITHGHGMVVDVADPTKLYIATHHGLYVLVDDKSLYRVGNNSNDYMGFAPDTKDPKVFFASGHPEAGGNIGFQKSQDGGFTWQVISDGIGGPVDFHALSVSPVNPNLVYGWYQGQLQRSEDGGQNWQAFKNGFVIVGLTADPNEENTIYAITPQGNGVMVSKDRGVNWNVLSKDLVGGLTSAFAVNSKDSKKMLSYSEKLKLAKSTDGGVTWQKVNQTFDGDILYIAYDIGNPSKVYGLTYNNSIYKSLDGGQTWQKIVYNK